MRPPADSTGSSQLPILIEQATVLATYLKTLSIPEIAKVMSISPKLALTTAELFKGWTHQPTRQRAAIDSFLGDIYSGLQVADLSSADRDYANEHLRILSGLYGVLRPLDGIYPYRFEMGYKLPSKRFGSPYSFWGSSIAATLPLDEVIINLAAVEYSKAVTPFVDLTRFITPSFLTISKKTGLPTFVTVHAKIARGAFAHWLIKQRITSADQLDSYTDLNYVYSIPLSTPFAPVYVCQEFGGLGLSVRLT